MLFQYTHLQIRTKNILSSITGLLDHHLKTYEDLILIGDFNEIETSSVMDSFSEEKRCKNIIKNKPCFKSVKDHVLT